LTARQTVLRGQQLAVWRGERCLFERLDFELAPAQLALVVGTNGSGKTTLLRVLAGLSPPTAGTATWHGTSVDALPQERRADIAYRGHLDGLKKDLTVRENLDFHAAIWGGTCDIPALLAELKLVDTADVRVRNLSAGQRRRTALATLRLTAAKLWVLDEPSTNLDSDGRATVVRWARRHLDDGGTAVIATHQPEEFATPGTVLIEI
jgi:heme exporter protein A